jgi:hypothetical protein
MHQSLLMNFDSNYKEVKKMLKNIKLYKDSPLWDKDSIAEATQEWFKYLS